MAFYQLKYTQLINAPLEDVWNFIANPSNLKKITPEYMGFEITTKTHSENIYPGMIISYLVAPLFGIKTTWVTEITHIKHHTYFIDEQRIGPYKLWHHQHIVNPQGLDTLMTDIVSYQPPFGVLGRLANPILIRPKLQEIFNYRKSAIAKIFSSEDV